ncbi:YesL family protein [Halobacillus sp. K22]|uniref:YesL family protein n=1 Tax=Halobacillus sp. K22 TaxID=3457431 RepID=UPI003FCD5FAB
MNLFSGALYRMMVWISRLAYLHLLWILFTLAGAVIFGLFPSTTAMFAIVRDWLKGKTDRNLFSTFWIYFKGEFWKSNRLGLVVLGLLLLISVDIYYIRTISEGVTWTYVPLFAFMFIFLLFLFYLFPVFVHYDLKIPAILKNTFLIMLISPVQSFLILVSLASLMLVFRSLPALAFLFGGSLYTFITMWLSLHAFRRIDRQKSA